MRKVFLCIFAALLLSVNANATNLFIDERMIFDQFLNAVSKTERRTRWDGLAQALHEQPTMIGWVFSYGGRGDSSCESMSYLRELRDYLVKKRKVSRDRLMLIDGGFMERGTTIMYLNPKDGKYPPKASPTITSNEILK